MAFPVASVALHQEQLEKILDIKAIHFVKTLTESQSQLITAIWKREIYCCAGQTDDEKLV